MNHLATEAADEKDRLVLLELLHDAACDAATMAGGFIERDFCIGGQLLRLRFAGPALVDRFCRAFAHLAVPVTADAAPDANICLWDTASTGRKLPLLIGNLLRLLRVTWSDVDIRGELRAYQSQRLRAMLWWPDMLEVMDLERKLGVFWIPDARAVPYYESGAPLRGMLHWWLSNAQRQLVHGGAVGTAEGGVLLGGVGGSGKSTTSLACLDSPLLYAGDDYTLVTNSPAPFVHSLYNTAKVKTLEDLQARFPHLESWVTNADGVRDNQEKPLMFVHEHRREKLINGFPLKALVFPRYVGNTKCQLEPLAPGSAFKALAPSTITQTPGAGAETMRALSALVRQVPSYLLGVSSDVRAIPDAIIDLLAKLPAS